MLDRSEPCRGRFSIFEKKSSIFSFGRQKANSLTFCAKISSDRQIWLKRYCNRVEWTQEMVFNTYHHIRTHLDEKIEIAEKNFKIICLTNFLKSNFKAFPKKLFLSKKLFFPFFYPNFSLSLKYRQIIIPEWKKT